MIKWLWRIAIGFIVFRSLIVEKEDKVAIFGFLMFMVAAWDLPQWSVYVYFIYIEYFIFLDGMCVFWNHVFI